MTEMFIPKKEKFIITVEAIVYVFLVILSSYFTIYGDIFLRMVPMIYFIGILGVILFNKPILTTILVGISTLTFSITLENALNKDVYIFLFYSVSMIVCGEITGYILNLLYDNFKLKKFIKYYRKIVYVVVLVIVIVVPVFLNNLVNGNFITFLKASKNVNKYITENYVYSNCYTKNISYKQGSYTFKLDIDGLDVILIYMPNNEISDVTMNDRKEKLNTIANAEINMLLKEFNLTELDVKCVYDYSKIATLPDTIKMNVWNAKKSEINKIVDFISHIKTWSKFNLVERIDIAIDDLTVCISKKDLLEKDITEEYILNGMNYEILGSKEDK